MAVLLRKSDGSALVGDAWSALCLCARCPRPRGAMGRQKCCENADRRPGMEPNPCAVGASPLGASEAKSAHKSSCAVRGRPNRRAIHRASLACAHFRGENLMRPENAVRRPRIGPNSRAVAVSSLGASPAECAHKTSCAVSTLRLPGRLREPPRQLRATPKYRMSPNPPPPERREKEAQTTRQHSAPNADAFGHCAFHRNNPPHPGNRPAARAARKPDGKNLMRREKPPPTPEPQPVDCVPSCCGAQ